MGSTRWCTKRRKKGEEDGFDGGRRWADGEEEDGELEREKKSEIKKGLLFIIKNNNILVKLTRLFSFRVEMRWSITVYWSLLLFI